MRARRLAALMALVAAALAAALAGPAAPGATAGRSGAHPYDYVSRQALVESLRQAGDHAGAYYHAASLAWLGPREYKGAAAGGGLVRDQRARERAAVADPQGVTAVIAAAAEAGQRLAAVALDGAIAQQARQVRREVEELVTKAEQVDRAVVGADPVARVALARIYLTLDDCLQLEGGQAAARARAPVLSRAASLAATVARWLPRSPGAQRTLAIARARLAALERRRELWEVAIESCERAHALDPADPELTEMVWTLHLRAGHWEEARRWMLGGPPTSAGAVATQRIPEAAASREESGAGPSKLVTD